MPKALKPFSYRVPEYVTDSYADRDANALEQLILDEGPESILAFILEPVGRLATVGLVGTAAFYKAVRDICDRQGLLLYARRTDA